MRAGWEMKTLGEIGKVSMCKRILKKQTTEVGEIPFYKIGTFGKTANAFISKELYNDFRSKYSFPKEGDVLISASGTIGRRVVFDGNPAYFQDSNIVWIDNDESQVLNEYLYTFYGYCDWNPSKGATISRLYNDDLRRIQIPIPPLPEQKAIVKILDEAFAKIDQAKANIEKNIENAKELFQSKLNEIFSQRGEGDAQSLPKGWEEKSLGDMSKIMYGYTSKVLENGNVQYVRITDIQNGNVDWPTVPTVNISSEEKPKYILSTGDIVFARTGATTGKSYLMVSPPNSVFASYLIRVQCNDEILNPSFLYLFFQSGIYWKNVTAGISGSAQGGFNATKLGKMMIHYPLDKKMQLKYVEQISDFKSHTNKITSNFKKKLNDLDELKKSLLQKAFSGELV